MIQTCFKILTSILALAAAPVSAQLREITHGAFTDVSPNRAYLLYHVLKGKNGLPAQPIFMRMSTDNEPAAEEPLFATRNGREFIKSSAARVYLLEVPPGDYLIYGLSLTGAAPTLATCFCLGTVAFTARPGMITDLGAFLMGNARILSDFPELATETGFGPSIDTGFYHPVAAIRQENTGRYFTNRSANIIIEGANFHAEGRFFDPRTTFVNRLAPLAGVLAYRDGKPINVATNSAVPDHFAQ